MPDAITLVQISELFGITVNDLLVDPNALPENPGTVERVMGKAVEKTLKRKADKSIILRLCSLLVWSLALLSFVIISSLDLPYSWMAFIYAIPVDAVVLLSMRSAWKDFRWNQTLISAIVWGAILSLYFSLLVFCNLNIWKLFLLGVPGQIAVFLWFRLYRKSPKEEQNG